MKNQYDEKYAGEQYYWSKNPSPICFRILRLLPPVQPERPLKLLDIGCGEGRNAVFFARNGYNVTAFDLSLTGIEKTKRLADEVGVTLHAFVADVNEYRLSYYYDILFSTGTLHYMPENLRKEIFTNYKEYTTDNGLHVFSVFVYKPFINKAPDSDGSAEKWISGELLTYYHDWKIEYTTEEIFDCSSGGILHKHATNRMVARKISGRL